MTPSTLRGVANGWLARLWPFTHFGGLAIIWRKVWVNTVVFARGFQKKTKKKRKGFALCLSHSELRS